MKTKVNFNEDGEVTQIKVLEGTETVAYAKLNGSGAYITTVYPLPGCEGVSVEHVEEMHSVLEALPFVEYAKFNYNP
jgi:hypothetical protein